MTEPRRRACSRDFPGTIEAAEDAEIWIAHQANVLGLGADAEFAINLCLKELFLNAVQHGRAKQASISVCAEPDGVTEAEDARQDEFGEDRLHALLADSEVADACHCVASVEAAVQEFARDAPQFDDITCLALRR